MTNLECLLREAIDFMENRRRSPSMFLEDGNWFSVEGREFIDRTEKSLPSESAEYILTWSLADTKIGEEKVTLTESKARQLLHLCYDEPIDETIIRSYQVEDLQEIIKHQIDYKKYTYTFGKMQ